MFSLSNEAQIFLNNNSDKKIVFTNGCFDLLHVGHLLYLSEARKLGDLLVVGLNSDSSVKKLKGENRPVNSELDRKFFLENLKSVDLVEMFSGTTPLELIKKIKPMVLVKGGDWEVQEIIGHDFVSSYKGYVKSLSFKDGYSTTNLIKKIRSTS